MLKSTFTHEDNIELIENELKIDYGSTVDGIARNSKTYADAFKYPLLGEEFAYGSALILYNKLFSQIPENSAVGNTYINQRKGYISTSIPIISVIRYLEDANFAFLSEQWNNDMNAGSIYFKHESGILVVINYDGLTLRNYDIGYKKYVDFYNAIDKSIKSFDNNSDKEVIKAFNASIKEKIDNFNIENNTTLALIDDIDIYSTTYTVKEINDFLNDIPKYHLMPKDLLTAVNVIDSTSMSYIGYSPRSGDYSINTKSVRIPSKDNDTFNMNYNIDMNKYGSDIIQYISSDNSGLVLLHGQPGTGKTQFINRLSWVAKMRGIDTIYIPTAFTKNFSDVKFTQFLTHYIDNNDCILILEDAELILQSRNLNNPNTSDVTSYLLNIIDGALSNRNILVVATFNTDLGNIDEALLRSGRLIDKMELKALSTEKANKLAKYLKINKRFDKETIVADIWQELKFEQNGLETDPELGKGFARARYQFPSSDSQGHKQ